MRFSNYVITGMICMANFNLHSDSVLYILTQTHRCTKKLSRKDCLLIDV